MTGVLDAKRGTTVDLLDNCLFLVPQMTFVLVPSEKQDSVWLLSIPLGLEWKRQF